MIRGTVIDPLNHDKWPNALSHLCAGASRAINGSQQCCNNQRDNDRFHAGEHRNLRMNAI